MAGPWEQAFALVFQPYNIFVMMAASLFGLFVGAPQLADIADGTLYLVFASTPGPQLAAIDAATGTTRWQVPIPRADTGSAAGAMTISEQRIYLPHFTWLDIFDRASGKHLATIGRW